MRAFFVGSGFPVRALSPASAAVEAAAETSAESATESSLGLEAMAVGAVDVGESVGVAVVSAVEVRGAVNGEGRVVAPAEGTVEDPVTRDEGVGAEPGIPIPAGTIPAGSPLTYRRAVSASASAR